MTSSAMCVTVCALVCLIQRQSMSVRGIICSGNQKAIPTAQLSFASYGMANAPYYCVRWTPEPLMRFEETCRRRKYLVGTGGTGL